MPRKSYLNRLSKRDIPVLKRILKELFNTWIVEEGKKCVYPACPKTTFDSRLECSHFFNAGTYKQVEYDPENCDVLCRPHHAGNLQLGWEFKKNGEYRDYKIAQLGEIRFQQLEMRARKSHLDYTPHMLHRLIDALRKSEDYRAVYAEVLGKHMKILQ